MVDTNSVVHELRARFDHFRTTGDESKIPSNLRSIVYHIAVQYGGKEEYEAVQKVRSNRYYSSSQTVSALD